MTLYVRSTGTTCYCIVVKPLHFCRYFEHFNTGTARSNLRGIPPSARVAPGTEALARHFSDGTLGNFQTKIPPVIIN